MAKSKDKKSVPIDAVQELADKAEQAASIGGTTKEISEVETTTQYDGQQKTQKVRVDLDFVRTTKVHIAMPCYGGMLTESTFLSFIKFSNTAREFGIDWTLETLVNESLISRARNTLTAKFLHQGTGTHLMFIDADIGWEPWHLLTLINHDRDVVGGLYPLKVMPLKWVVNGVPNGESGEDGIQEVSKTGTGFLLTKRHVFEKLVKHPAVKHYKNDIGMDVSYDQYMRTYFDTAVREGRYLSEDWTFCSNWRDMGGKIFVDKRVLLRHAGHFNYCVEAHESMIDKFGQIYVKTQEEKKVPVPDTPVAE
jgi:hypothetical protein